MLSLLIQFSLFLCYKLWGGKIKILDMNSDALSSDQIIEIRKVLNQQTKNARINSRHKRCLLCDKEGGFCNSHTIPQFCLENIAWNGKLDSIYTLIDSDLLKKDSGVNNAGTFHIICKPCDSRVFHGYENEAVYDTFPSQVALTQIALKTALRDIYKHEAEIELFKGMKQLVKEKAPLASLFFNVMLDAQIEARTRDIQECYDVFNSSKMHLEAFESWHRIVSFDKLNYTSPIAFQGMVALVTGVNGEIINNIFNHSKKYKLEYLHIAVFPLKHSTAIILFLDSKCKRYKQFEKHLASLTQEERLEIINKIIFLYTEDYYLSKQLSENTIKELEETAKTVQDISTCNPRSSIKAAVRDYDLRRRTHLPNILSEEYQVIIENGDKTN